MPKNDVSLFEICNPKQWPTISKSELKENGYPVYGANGIIGFYDEYNHENPTLLIGCRGSVGSLHITSGKCYVTGNSMALDNLDAKKYTNQFLYYFFKFRGFSDIVTGSSQPQITQQGLKKIFLPKISIAEQETVSRRLDLVSKISKERTGQLSDLDQYLRSLFIEVFGDPVTNPKGWPKKKFKDVAKIKTGNTPSRANPTFYGDHIEWIKSDNLNTPYHIATRATEFLSKEGARVGRVVQPNSILVTCIAGSKECIGNAAIVDRSVAFNQQINSITCGDELVPEFVYLFILVGKKIIQSASTNSMKGMVSKGNFEEIEIYVPPKKLQVDFASKFAQCNTLKIELEKSSKSLNKFFQSLLTESFS